MAEMSREKLLLAIMEMEKKIEGRALTSPSLIFVNGNWKGTQARSLHKSVSYMNSILLMNNKVPDHALAEDIVKGPYDYLSYTDYRKYLIRHAIEIVLGSLMEHSGVFYFEDVKPAIGILTYLAVEEPDTIETIYDPDEDYGGFGMFPDINLMVESISD